MSLNIEFTNVGGVPDQYSPIPASELIPEWYKKIDSYMSGEKKPDLDGNTTGTIKRCMPVFDSIVNGYLIVTPADVWVSQIEDYDLDGVAQGTTSPYFQWANFELIKTHPIEQAPNHPNRNGHKLSYPKWINPWAIKTPPGYSTAFFQPWHRESIFSILPGIVDTDTYFSPVNFPFVLNDVTFEGLIPAGTPMAQVMPFKRESWKMSFGGNDSFVEQRNLTINLRTRFFDSYKTQYRQPKEYK